MVTDNVTAFTFFPNYLANSIWFLVIGISRLYIGVVIFKSSIILSYVIKHVI